MSPSTTAIRPPLHFNVDAALLRELGERLIGHPHIALAELIKNAYDADAATCCIIFGEDRIEVVDDGHGMTASEFEQFWLRIGSTHKVDDRWSRNLHRPLTGSKGIGRLAVQFLASHTEIYTTSGMARASTTRAEVDWSTIEDRALLQSVDVVVTDVDGPPAPYPNGSTTGTRIILTRLKDSWDEAKIEMLGRQIWVLRSPFRRVSSSPARRGPEDFDVEIEAPRIENAKAALDSTLDALFENSRARIHGTLESGRSTGEAIVRVDFMEGYPEGQPAEHFQENVRIPVVIDEGEPSTPLIDRVDFDILVFRLEGRQKSGIYVRDLRSYLERFGNVSIYDTGFRLPYYGADQDWLNIQADHARRLSKSDLLPDNLRSSQPYMHDLPEVRRIFGAVNIRTNHERAVAEAFNSGPGEFLELSAGRDRLHNNQAHAQLRDLVRFSLDFYANRYAARKARGIDERRDTERPSAKQERALEVLAQHKEAIPQPVYREVVREVRDALKGTQTAEVEMDRRAALLAPLASTGMVALALNHELSREKLFLDRSVLQLRNIAQEHRIPQLDRLADELVDTTRRLNAIQQLFAPLLTDDDKEAKNRLRVLPIVQHATHALRPLMGGLRFDIEEIPPELRFPVGSLAEWSAIIQNVVTNAWNATLTVGNPVVHFSGGQSRKRQWLRISDTGTGLGIPLEESNKLFEPFARRLDLRSDVKSIAIGGQGLGLSIVRMIARRRGVEVKFVNPPTGLVTTIEMSWRD